MQNLDLHILAIESSCDDTSCAVLRNDVVLSNIVAGQEVHKLYGGVVPELASRDHQKHIVPVAEAALQKAGVELAAIDAIAVTSGPGLMGSLLVGMSFAKSLALALQKPLIGVNHMQAHVLAHFIREPGQSEFPVFPFLCLTVSGGHTQIVRVNDYLDFELLGQTIDDAVGEAFDKAAKVLGLPYPGGPLIDKLAASGNAARFSFADPHVPSLDYSFSGIKTSFLYFIRDHQKVDGHFIEKNLEDICASYQQHLVKVLLKNVTRAIEQTGIKQLALAGGVSANSLLRAEVLRLQSESNIKVFIPPFSYCTDNAAMIGIAAYYMYKQQRFAGLSLTPEVRMTL